MQKENIPLLSIICTSYNHEKYIKECLDGFLIQQTNFLFEIIVHDDASTDDTAKIIREYELKYPHLFNNIYQIENHFTKPDVNIWLDIVFPLARGKYIAICEGDDYWTDPLKLQKQFDFLEANLDFGLVYTDSLAYYQRTNELNVLEKPKNKQDSFFKDLIFGSSNIYTLTVCFRREYLKGYVSEISPYSKGWLLGDLPLWLFIATKTKAHYIDEATTVYRVLEESASNTQNLDKHLDFKKSVFQIKLFFLKKYYKQDLKTEKQITSIYLYEQLVWNILFKGNFRQFLTFLYQFYLENNNLKLFAGSFYQILKKVKAQIIEGKSYFLSRIKLNS